MANYLVLGLFEEVSSAAAAIEGVRRIGVPDNRVSVMSGIPIRPRLLGRRPGRNWLAPVALLGALLGMGAALTLLIGAPLLYPLYQGGQPLIPIPPSIIITFELTMLGTMWVTFGGFVLLNRFPRFGRPVYDPRITAGKIGVLVETDEGRAGRVADLFQNGNAADVQRYGARPQIDTRAWVRWLAVLAVLLGLVLIITPLFVYDVIRIPFGTQMDDQVSVNPEGAPRLAAPADRGADPGAGLRLRSAGHTTRACQPELAAARPGALRYSLRPMPWSDGHRQRPTQRFLQPETV